MLFNVQSDTGDLIEGYLIPDGFSDVPKVLISDSYGLMLELPCDQMHGAVLAAGRHETGFVGFKITKDIVPELAERKTLCIRDSKSELLIYRRPLLGRQVNLKIVRFETQMFPHVAFDRQMYNLFQYALPSLERFGNETALQAFHLEKMSSMYLSGRLQLRSYQEFLDKNFKAIALLTDPYYEMALRIAMLKRLSSVKLPFLGPRDQMVLSPAVAYFSEVDINDVGAIGKALKRAPAKARIPLLSPTTRQFACADADQPSTRKDIAAAMDMMSRFEAIGHINDPLEFACSLSELFNVELDMIPTMQRNQAVSALAAELKTISVAEEYLEDDLILDYYVRQAMGTGVPYES